MKDIKNYEGLREAANEMGLDQSNISAVCLGKRKTCGSYHFEYVN